MLVIGAIPLLAPLIWTVSTSLKPEFDVFEVPPQLIPGTVRLENYVDIFELAPFAQQYFNSVYIAVVNVVGTLVVSSLAGYALARLRFPGRGLILPILLMALLLPEEVTIVPLFVLMSELGWVGTHLPLLIEPIFGVPTVVGTFLMRQFFLTLPRDLADAGRVDGLGEFGVFRHVALPLARPALATLGGADVPRELELVPHPAGLHLGRSFVADPARRPHAVRRHRRHALLLATDGGDDLEHHPRGRALPLRAALHRRRHRALRDQGLMADPLRVAIVGAGWAGQRQARAALEIPADVEVVALVDRDAEHLAAIGDELGIRRQATDLDENLGDPDIEAVSICTPHALHQPQAIAAASAGKHILVEKPMATDVAGASRMMGSAEVAGVTLYVAEHHLYEARFKELRRIVREGAYIGELTFAACIAGYRAPSPSYGGRRAWLTEPSAGGTGTWVLQGIHTVAALRYVLGEVVSVYLLDHRTRSFERPDLEATMSGVVELANGLVVWLVQTTETALKPRLTGFRLYGDAGVVIGDDESYRVYVGDPREGSQPATYAYPAQPISSYALELRAFADAVAGRAAGPTSAVSERRSMAVIEAGLESARTRLPVDLRQRYPDIW